MHFCMCFRSRNVVRAYALAIGCFAAGAAEAETDLAPIPDIEPPAVSIVADAVTIESDAPLPVTLRALADAAGITLRLPPPPPVRAVPASWNLSRFLANVIRLEETLGMIQRDDRGAARAAHGRAARLRPVPRLRRHRHRQSQRRAAGARQGPDRRPRCRLGPSRKRTDRCAHRADRQGGAQKPRQLRCLLLPGDTGADKITPASSTTMLADGDDAGEPLRSAAVAWSNPVLNGDLVAACCNLMQERF
jgi:hypothetical protein